MIVFLNEQSAISRQLSAHPAQTNSKTFFLPFHFALTPKKLKAES